MKMLAMTRRRLLQGLGPAAFALPHVCRLRRASAARAAPKLIIMYSANGVHMPQWTYADALKPIEPHKRNVLVIRNLDMKALVGGGHPELNRTILTGRGAGGISVDQHIANFVRGKKRFASLELRWPASPGEGARNMCYRSAGSPVPFQNDPVKAVATIFNGVMPGAGGVDPAADKLRQLRLKLVDNIFSATRPILPRLDAEGRQRIEEEMTSWQGIQKRLQTPVAPAAGCQAPAALAVMPEILVKAVACDLTQVATITCGDYHDKVATGVTQHHHALSHHQVNLPGAETERLHGKVTSWWASNFAAILGMLEKHSAEDGTPLLDNCAVLWTNEQSTLGPHGSKNLPYLLAGKAGGMRPGREISHPIGTPHNNLLLTLCNVMGLPDTSFGDPMHCTGPVAVT